MSERIRELTFQAGAKLYSKPPMREVTGVSMSFESVEKFAELIVREVFAKIEDERFEIYQPVKESVMKHFGVEE